MRIPLAFRLVCIASALAVMAPAAHATWPEQGAKVGDGAGLQYSTVICADPAGGVLVSWVSLSDTEFATYVTRYDSGGNLAAGWPTSGVRVGDGGVSPQPLFYLWRDHSIASDGAGGAFVLWPAFSGFRVAHVTANGQLDSNWPAGGLRPAPEPITIWSATILADGAGGVFVAWSDARDGWRHVRVHRLQVDGSPYPGWPTDGVLTKTGFNEQDKPVLSLDGSGGVWVGWSDDGTAAASRAQSLSVQTYLRVLQHVTAAGVVDPLVPASGIGVGGFDVYPEFGMVGDESGGVFVLWDGSDQPHARAGSFVQRLGPTGTPSSGWPALGNLYSTSGNSLHGQWSAADGLGGVLTAWNVYVPGAGHEDVRVQRIRPDATIPPGWDPLGVRVGAALANGDLPLTVTDGSGGAMVVWSDSSLTPGETDLFAQRVDAGGSLWPISGSDRLAVCTAPGFQGGSRLEPAGPGSAYVSWVDTRSDQGDVYVRKISIGESPTATMLVRFDAEPIEAGIRVSWEFSGPSPFSEVELFRASNATGPWTPVTAAIRREAGVSVAEDHSIEAGNPWWYRLEALSPDGERMAFGPIVVEAHPRLQDGLTAVSPNPSRGPVTIQFALTAPTEVRLSILDLAGREIANLAEGRHERGSYQLNWDGRAKHDRVPAGIYFVRYSTPERITTRRLAIAR
ncbi:MAG: T9SS type A sorting domain-containing protein [Candidatus Eisenbacteria bacterium]|uniref:T9SS type A sorting domain-containing protein n=1 Tax=Eiseniibacteriota bacterium TaxID=2212470 RepID=A0A849SFE5_UNCEI|nr:T9SS type A sorting domain-containing protein [Candidatus Eisenbacteria bacterium]